MPSSQSMPSNEDKASLLNSISFRGYAYQAVLILIVVATGWYLYSNVTGNLERQGIATGFGFLDEPAGFDIGESFIPFDASQSYGDALLVGILNTLYISFFSIITATILGVTMGVLSVSNHPVFQHFSRAYVEIARNIPVVLHVIFFATLIQNLPLPKQAFHPLPGVFLSNRGLIFAVPVYDPVYLAVFAAFLAAIAGAIGLHYWARRHREKTGQYIEAGKMSLILVLGLPLLVWFVGGAPLEWNAPVLKGFNFRGGFAVTPEFVALLVGLSFYSGAFIAEIVRSGIEAVPKGQFEAAKAVGLKPGFVMRYVIFPQALRIMIPPIASKYLSLAKNSSLGVLIGYPDIVNIGNTTMNQTGQAVEAVVIMMLVYLTISLVISTFMNVYNHLSRIRER